MNNKDKDKINIILDQNVKDTTKEKRDIGYLFQFLMKQRKSECDEARMAALKDKKLLSVEEAAELYGIGRAKIRELTSDDNCPFVLWIGGHRKIKREEFEKYVMNQFSI